MLKKYLVIILLCIGSAPGFSQIYGVGNGCGFSYNCYVQADNPFLSIYSTGNGDGFASVCFDWKPPILVPLTLLTFDADCFNSKTIVQWSTASGAVSGYFSVERSRDGIQFQPADNVQIRENSTPVNHYNFIDNVVLPGRTYYRLKQVMNGGRYEYSNVISVNCTANNDATVRIYPNPTTKLLYVITHQPNVTFVVKNVLGQPVFHSKAVSARTVIDLGEFPGGVYYLEVQTSYGASYHIVVLRKE
jgi:hypothetical protein